LLRIVAGEHRGRLVSAPPGRGTRPTSEMAREALFDILQGRTQGALFADLFAGSGAVGIEALSQGARGAVFVERDRACAQTIRKNLGALGLQGRASVVEQDLWKFGRCPGGAALRGALAALAARTGEPRAGGLADIVFADPPYAMEGMGRFVETLAALPVYAPGATLVVEHMAKIELPPEPGAGFALWKSRGHGDTAMTFYRKDIS